MRKTSRWVLPGFIALSLAGGLWAGPAADAPAAKPRARGKIEWLSAKEAFEKAKEKETRRWVLIYKKYPS